LRTSELVFERVAAVEAAVAAQPGKVATAILPGGTCLVEGAEPVLVGGVRRGLFGVGCWSGRSQWRR